MRRIAVLALLAHACVPVQDLQLPGLEAPARAMILAIERDGAPPELVALEPGRPASLALPARTALTLLVFERSLREMQLAPGVVPQAETNGRELAGWAEAFTRSLDGAAWTPVSDLPPAIQSLRLPAFDPERCILGGECVRGGYCEACAPAAPPRLPDEVMRPQLGACPAGWVESALEVGSTLSWCDPGSAVETSTCADGQVTHAGGPPCAPIGAPCTELYAADRPPDATHVRELAPQGGDGSPAAPYATIAEALADPTVSTIALAAGTYVVPQPLLRDLTVIGACTGRTIIAGDLEVLPGRALNLRQLTIRGGLQGLAVRSGGSARVTSVLVKETTREGLVVESRDVEVHDSFMHAPGRVGVIVRAGGHLEATRLRVEDVARIGLGVEGDGSSASVEDLVVRDANTAGALAGAGVYVATNARLDLARAVVTRGYGSGLVVTASSSATIADLVVSHFESRPSGGNGEAIGVSRASTLELSRALFDRNSARGILVHGEGSSANIEDVIAHCTNVEVGIEDAAPGLGVQVGGSALLMARRVASIGDGGGVHMEGGGDPGGTSMLHDIYVDGRCEGELASSTRGVQIRGGTRAAITRVEVRSVVEEALHIADDETQADVDDLLVAERSTRGFGVVCGGAALELCSMSSRISGALIEDAVETGGFIDGATVVLSDVTVRRGPARRTQACLTLLSPSKVTLEHGLLSDCTTGIVLQRGVDETVKTTHFTNNSVAVRGDSYDDVATLFDGNTFEAHDELYEDL